MSVVLYEENEQPFKSEDELYYVKIKSYISLLRSPNFEQKEMAQKYFEENKKDTRLYNNLIKISKNMSETNDIRIHSMQILQKFYVLKPEYIKYKADEENLLDIGIEPEIHNALPASNQDSLIDSTPLALKSCNYLDSLSYIDNYNDTRLKDETERLIKEEMSKFKPRDYLSEIPYPKMTFMSSDLIREEMTRLEKKLPNPITISDKILNKFDLPVPSKYYDEQNWKSLLNQISVSSQHINLKSVNLELLIKYGPGAWRKYLTRLENIQKQLENEKSFIENENNEVNKRRKINQVEAQKSLNELENKFKYHLGQVNALRKECMKMKFKIKRLHIAKQSKLEKNKVKNKTVVIPVN